VRREKQTTILSWFVFLFASFPTSLIPNPYPLLFPRQPNLNLQHDRFDNGNKFDNSHRFDDKEAGPTSVRGIRQWQDNPSMRPNLSNPTNVAHRQHVQGIEPMTKKENDTKRREMGLQQQ